MIQFICIGVFLVTVCSGKNLEDEFYRGIEKYQDFYDLPKLPYSYNALEPWIDAKTVEVHHGVIFANYTIKMNTALKEWRKSKVEEELSKSSIVNILKNIESVPEKWRIPLQNAAGGYLSHLFYFSTLSPNPEGIKTEIPKNFERVFMYSYPNISYFQNAWKEDALNHFGTGHVWLCRVAEQNYLTIYVTLEELTPFYYNFQPVLILDLWEHAYFIKNQNDREKYLANWWKVVDWRKVEKLFNWWKSFDPPHDEL